MIQIVCVNFVFSLYFSTMSTNICLILCIFMIFNNTNYTAIWHSTIFTDSDVYYVSQSNTGVEMANLSSRNKQSIGGDALNGYEKGYMFCKLIQRGSLALVLIALSGDVEVNPGFVSLDDLKSIRGLKIAHLNIRSLRHKSDSLRLEGLDSNMIDILTLSETWLDESIQDFEISLPGFVCVRKDRIGAKKGYGGVAIFVRVGLPFRVRYDIDVGQSECLWIELTRAKCKPTIICSAYRAPDKNFDDFLSDLQSCMPALDLEKSDLVFLGDLNVNMLSNSKAGSSEKQKLLNFMHTMDLTQLIKEPTRVTDTARSLIDVIFVYNEHRVVDSGVIPISLSDHYLILCILKAGVSKAKPRTMEYRSYKHFDVNSFNRDLNNVPWSILDIEENIDDALHTWNCLFSETADEHAPIKKRHVKGIPSPWMNNKISEQCETVITITRKPLKLTQLVTGKCTENCGTTSLVK